MKQHYKSKLPLSMFRKVKKSGILFLLTLFLSSLHVDAANRYKISIERSDTTILSIIKEIEQSSNYKFFFNNNQIDVNEKVSIHTNNATIEEILNNILKDTNLTYTIENDNILLVSKSTLSSGATPTQTIQQNRVIKGVVFDEEGFPVTGASVVEKGTTNGTVTDIDGNFSLVLKGDKKLITISFIGYITQSIATKDDRPVQVILKEDRQMLDEVVVVGFGSQKKENLTGAVSQVKMADVLGDRPVVNAMSALQGTMPGLQISGGSSPGQSKEFNIRGMTSINGGAPLVLIDNVPGDIDMINPEDIESISVLKDASSSAIYGARAAFGVVLVTTKKGEKGKRPQINYNTNFGFQNSINRPKQANAMDFLHSYKDAGFLAGNYFAGQNIDQWIEYLTAYREDPSQFEIIGDGIYIPTENNAEGIRYYLHEKDLYKNMLDKYGFMQSHNLSVSGGTERTSYRLSLGYNDEDGILYSDKDTYKRVSAGAFISTDITDWLTQAVDIKYGRSTSSMPNAHGELYGLRLTSLTPEGEMEANDGTVLPVNTPKNFLKYASPIHTKNENPRILSKTILKPIKGLEMVFEYTYDKKIYDNKKYNQPFNYTSIQLDNTRSASVSKYENTKTSTNYNAINAYATYLLPLTDEHNMKAMIGFNQESSKFEQLYAYRLDMINEEHPSFSSATGETHVKDSYSQYTVRGAFFRLNYDYKGRYLVEANGRYDGSSKFPRKNRFGFFPSFSLGWNVARESFMQAQSHWLNELKLRASWGQIGNQAISPYAYSPIMGGLKAPWIVNGEQPTTLDTPKMVSDNFTWEKVQTLDIGLDFSAFNNRLKTTFDWYQRDTKDMLAAGIELPAVVGAIAPLQNIADLQTRGWELSVNWRDYIGDFEYRIGFNLFDSTSKITKYLNESNILSSHYKGKKINEIWGYVTDGFYTIDDFEDTNSWKLKDGVTSIKNVNVRPGDHKFVNLRDDEGSINQIDNGNNTLANPGDMKVIGNSTPRFQYGISLGANWKGFDLNILLQGVGKRDYWNGGVRRFPFAAGEFGTIFSDQLNYWKPTDPETGDYTPVNSNPKYFRIYNQRENASSNTRVQTRYLLDASYLRIKNVTLGYTIPQALVQKIGLSKVKLFTSIENLHTFDSLPSGYDPERLNWGYPFYRTISLGFNVTL